MISLNSLDPDVANDLWVNGHDESWVNGHDESYTEEIDEPHIVGERDGVTYQITWLGGVALLWVLDGPTGLADRLCSPCVPNAADLDSGFVFEEERDGIDDGWPCYVVPRNWLAKIEVLA